MIFFCIYTEQITNSIEGAKRCVQSAKNFGVDVEMYKSVWHEDVYREAEIQGLKLKYSPRKTSHTDFKNMTAPATRIANGITHYKLYDFSRRNNTPICILEHDSYMIDYPPNYIYDGIIQISCINKPWNAESLFKCSRANKMKKYEPQRVYDWSWEQKKGIIQHPLSGMNSTSGYVVGPGAANKMAEYILIDGVGFADRVRTEHIGEGNLYLQNPQSIICDHSIVSTKGIM